MRMESMKPTAQHLQQWRRPMMLQLQSRLKVNELMRLFFFFFFLKFQKASKAAREIEVSAPPFFFITSCPTEDEMLNIFFLQMRRHGDKLFVCERSPRQQ